MESNTVPENQRIFQVVPATNAKVKLPSTNHRGIPSEVVQIKSTGQLNIAVGACGKSIGGYRKKLWPQYKRNSLKIENLSSSKFHPPAPQWHGKRVECSPFVKHACLHARVLPPISNRLVYAAGANATNTRKAAKGKSEPHRYVPCF